VVELAELTEVQVVVRLERMVQSNDKRMVRPRQYLLQ
jgi:hypothetical protein